jgi:hypothetical protein
MSAVILLVCAPSDEQHILHWAAEAGAHGAAGTDGLAHLAFPAALAGRLPMAGGRQVGAKVLGDMAALVPCALAAGRLARAFSGLRRVGGHKYIYPLTLCEECTCCSAHGALRAKQIISSINDNCGFEQLHRVAFPSTQQLRLLY